MARGSVRLYLSEHTGDALPNTPIHLYINDADAVSEEFGIPVDEEALPGAGVTLNTPMATGLTAPSRRLLPG